jgi:hypothetical protein
MKIGYARVSTDAQETHLQMDALKRAKCSRIYQEKVSGAKAERPELMKLLDNAAMAMSSLCGSWIAWRDHSANSWTQRFSSTNAASSCIPSRRILTPPRRAAS